MSPDSPCDVPSLGPLRRALKRLGRAGTIETEAKASEVSRPTWIRWERGEFRPTLAVAQSIAERWGVTLADLQHHPEGVERVRLDSEVRALVDAHGAREVREAVDRTVAPPGARSSTD